MAKLFANSEDPGQMLHSVASDDGQHCLPRTFDSNIGNLSIFIGLPELR